MKLTKGHVNNGLWYDAICDCVPVGIGDCSNNTRPRANTGAVNLLKYLETIYIRILRNPVLRSANLGCNLRAMAALVVIGPVRIVLPDSRRTSTEFVVAGEYP